MQKNNTVSKRLLSRSLLPDPATHVPILFISSLLQDSHRSITEGTEVPYQTLTIPKATLIFRNRTSLVFVNSRWLRYTSVPPIILDAGKDEIVGCFPYKRMNQKNMRLILLVWLLSMTIAINPRASEDLEYE